MTDTTRPTDEELRTIWAQQEGFHPDPVVYAPAVLAAVNASSEVGEAWRPMETAPKDDTLIRLLVRFTENAIDDSTDPLPTIGMNACGNTGEDEWKFAGWSWCHDCFTQGEGEPVGWLPMVAATRPAPAADAPEFTPYTLSQAMGSKALPVLQAIGDGVTLNQALTVDQVVAALPALSSIAHGSAAADAAPQAMPADEVTLLRRAQAQAVMLLIGPLLDAWEGVANDEKAELPGVAKWMRALNHAMETATPQQTVETPAADEHHFAQTVAGEAHINALIDDIVKLSKQGTREARHVATELVRDALARPAPEASAVDARFAELLAAEHALSDSYVRIRQLVGAMKPPDLEPAALYAYVEGIVAEKCRGSAVDATDEPWVKARAVIPATRPIDWQQRALAAERAMKAMDEAIAARTTGAVPAGWKLERVGNSIIVNGPVGGCGVNADEESPRLIPGSILYALCDAMLKAAPALNAAPPPTPT